MKMKLPKKWKLVGSIVSSTLLLLGATTGPLAGDTNVRHLEVVLINAVDFRNRVVPLTGTVIGEAILVEKEEGESADLELRLLIENNLSKFLSRQLIIQVSGNDLQGLGDGNYDGFVSIRGVQSVPIPTGGSIRQRLGNLKGRSLIRLRFNSQSKSGVGWIRFSIPSIIPSLPRQNYTVFVQEK